MILFGNCGLRDPGPSHWKGLLTTQWWQSPGMKAVVETLPEAQLWNSINSDIVNLKTFTWLLQTPQCLNGPYLRCCSGLRQLTLLLKLLGVQDAEHLETRSWDKDVNWLVYKDPLRRWWGPAVGCYSAPGRHSHCRSHLALIQYLAALRPGAIGESGCRLLWVLHPYCELSSENTCSPYYYIRFSFLS